MILVQIFLFPSILLWVHFSYNILVILSPTSTYPSSCQLLLLSDPFISVSNLKRIGLISSYKKIATEHNKIKYNTIKQNAITLKFDKTDKLKEKNPKRSHKNQKNTCLHSPESYRKLS